MRSAPTALAVEAERVVRAEVFTLALGPGGPVLTGPQGPTAWHVDVDDAEHPMDSVHRTVTGALEHTLLVHSTSWRWVDGSLILTFLAIVDPRAAEHLETAPIARTGIARGTTTSAPNDIDDTQIIEHGLRHLAWLADDDRTVAATLPPAWHEVLDGYVHEPFRQLGTRWDLRAISVRCACGRSLGSLS